MHNWLVSYFAMLYSRKLSIIGPSSCWKQFTAGHFAQFTGQLFRCFYKFTFPHIHNVICRAWFSFCDTTWRWEGKQRTSNVCQVDCFKVWFINWLTKIIGPCISLVCGIGELDVGVPSQTPPMPHHQPPSLPYLLLDVRDKESYDQCHIIGGDLENCLILIMVFICDSI